MTSDEAETRRVQGVEEVRVSRGLSMDSERHTRRGPVSKTGRRPEFILLALVFGIH